MDRARRRSGGRIVALTLTGSAAEAIRQMLGGYAGGLRISAEADEEGRPGLHLSFAPEPEEGDETITQHGVDVYLDPSAADALDDKVLDAEAHGDHSHFSIRGVDES